MKKILSAVALAALLASGHAAAQSSVTVYGLLDAGVEYINHVGANNGSLTRMPTNTGTLPSRLGFRGSEDLGNGLAAIFTLEMGLTPDQGTLAQGGRIFGRQAFVGLRGTWGTFSLGRQYTYLFWSLLDAEPVGPSLYGVGSLDARVTNPRTDNTLAYSGRFGGLSVGATYSLGRDAVNAGPSLVGANCAGEGSPDNAACREWSAMVKYDAPIWGVALAYDRAKGRTVGAAPDAVFGNLTSSSQADGRLVMDGYVKLGNAKLGAGVIRRRNDGDPVKPKSDLWFAGVSYPVTPQLTVDAGYSTLRYKNVSDRNASVITARLTYALSKRTAVYTQAGFINNDTLSAVAVSGGALGGNPAAGNSQTGFNVGVRHSF